MVARIVELPSDYSFYLFGPRQTGKSTLIKKKFGGKRIWEINLLYTEILLKYLKDPSIFRKEALYKIERERIKIIFIDEIQKHPLLLNEIQAIISIHPKVQFILTGSSSRKLKRGAANLLAGRLVERFLHPFTFYEINKDFDLFNTLIFGSLPPVFNQPISVKKDILSAYVNTYLREEILAEGLVRNLGGFSNFLDIAASQNGELVNFNSIGRDCGLPVRTVQSYFQILEDTLIAVRLDGWKRSIRKRLTTHPKFYLFDTGVTNAICRRLDSSLEPILQGRLFEQWLILETHRLLNYLQSPVKMYYWRTSAGAEVDIVFEKNNKLIAGCEIKSGKTITSAHTSGLRAFREEYPGIPLFIVCDSIEPFLIGSIEILPWKNYLNRLKENKIWI